MADDVTTAAGDAATETAEPAGTSAAVEDTTAGGDVTTEAEAGTATATSVTVDDSTDVFTSVKPGNGHGTDAEDATNDTVTAVSDTTATDLDVTTQVPTVTGKNILSKTTIYGHVLS